MINLFIKRLDDNNIKYKFDYISGLFEIPIQYRDECIEFLNEYSLDKESTCIFVTTNIYSNGIGELNPVSYAINIIKTYLKE